MSAQDIQDRVSAADVTADLERRLRARYPAPAYAYLPQVGDSTGFSVHRHADAIVMGLWPSRGLHLMGFEIKAGRGDWLRELRDPRKAEDIAAFCDQWWVVAPADVILPRQRRAAAAQTTLDGIGDEVESLSADHLDLTTFPDRWGLMVPHGRGQLRTVKPAQTLEAQPLDRAFLAAVLRRAAEHVVLRSSIDAELRAAFQRGLEQGTEHARQERRWQADEDRRRLDALAEFEAVSGVKIDGYRGARIGEAVAMVLRWQDEGRFLASRLEDTRRTLVDLVEHIDRALASGALAAPEQEGGLS
jgi:hypothetical protein